MILVVTPMYNAMLLHELRASKGSTRAALLNEYERLGRPCKNRSIYNLVKEVEEELSASVDFMVETTVNRAGVKETYLKTGQSCVKLPEDAWQPQVFKEPKSNIPYISNGRASFRCISFFQESKGDDSKQGGASQPPTGPTGAAQNNFKAI